MKKVLSVLLFIVMMIVLNYGCLELVDNYYDTKVRNSYCDSVGNLCNADKNQGKILQEISSDRKDNLMIFGSSELNTLFIPQNPANFFKNKRDGFQINFIGRGYCQNFIHAMDFLAMGEHLRNKKIVFVLSAQWFEPSGLTSDAFNMNFSELQFYSILFNKNISKSVRLQVASRVNQLLKGTKDYPLDEIYSHLYSKNDTFTKLVCWVMKPYCKYKYKVLSIKDKINAYKTLKNFKGEEKIIKPQNENIDWNKELKVAENNGKSSCTDNDLGVYNEYYDEHIKPYLKVVKNRDAGESYLNSPEYNDLKFMMNTAKKLNMKILFISMPENGKWYDYIGHAKQDRQEYYKKVKDLVKSNGFQIEDYSNEEYNKYFLCDVMHLGWKGWVKIDEAMDKFYHQN